MINKAKMNIIACCKIKIMKILFLIKKMIF